eukprot:1159666-Pelagomonas_calceolata.AAC.3
MPMHFRIYECIPAIPHEHTHHHAQHQLVLHVVELLRGATGGGAEVVASPAAGSPPLLPDGPAAVPEVARA